MIWPSECSWQWRLSLGRRLHLELTIDPPWFICRMDSDVPIVLSLCFSELWSHLYFSFYTFSFKSVFAMIQCRKWNALRWLWHSTKTHSMCKHQEAFSKNFFLMASGFQISWGKNICYRRNGINFTCHQSVCGSSKMLHNKDRRDINNNLKRKTIKGSKR